MIFNTIKEIFELFIHRRKFYMFPILILLIALMGVTTLSQSGLIAFHLSNLEMQLSSPRFKSIAVTAGLTFWFFIITSATGYFSYESLLIFSISILTITQIFAYKVSKGAR